MNFRRLVLGHFIPGHAALKMLMTISHFQADNRRDHFVILKSSKQCGGFMSFEFTNNFPGEFCDIPSC